MVRTAIQLYTLRGLEEPIWETLSRVADTTFEGVELYDAHFDSFADESALERTVDALVETDIVVAGAHVGVDRIEDEFDDIVSACKSVDASRVVVPSYDASAFQSVAGIEAAADRLAEVATKLDVHDLDLLYHNHTFEFDVVDGRVAFERFVDCADGRFGFEPDVGLAAHAGYDPFELLEITAGNAPLVHLTDTVPGDESLLHVDVRDGAVDVDACASAAASVGAEWFICENGLTEEPLASLERGSATFADSRARAETVDHGC
ncbi:sugar phosphate isomerase/epimerase family protein [Natronosalvus halobius]|uniref:sugar phosphate isomerase/epimerase family protein n=1 Tax=Natronosalvus halobius TaxID=2953746 RepID=UPI0020A14580|nr:TIM barrel protein [Natronosalvus halobius]USZ72406.1 sugar phosphate isomerase/epimerase [Natronosalvus halobius]